jgi:ribosomal protein S18 acetylase RimI-like enzyme
VTGSSMLPFLRDGDVVVLEPAPAPRLGDIVLVQTDPLGAAKRYVLHRIVRMDGGAAFFIRGDAQPQCEGPLERQAVLGRVVTASHDGCDYFLDRGWWRLAGRVWLVVHPLGFGLLQLAGFIRRVGGWALRHLQRVYAWRVLAKRFHPAYGIYEATPNDLMALYTRSTPSTDCPPSTEKDANPYLTNYVAKSGSSVMGLVRLMRHPEADIPQVGYWLYSLTVRTRYRGMGIGEALTRRVIEQARAEGALELFLRVFEDNAPALALYRKLGFEQVTLPALEADLVADVQKYRRRRLPLRKPLG